MIRFVAADDPRFKSMVFGGGLNAVLADVTDQSTDKDSRNGTGKSSLIRVFHFLLGGNADKKSFFCKPELRHTSFALGLDLGSATVTVVRQGADANIHLVAERAAPLKHDEFPRLDNDGNAPAGWEKISLTQWKHRLGKGLFDLEQDMPKYSPSVRSLLAYLIRREKDGGLRSPFRHTTMQQPWDAQVALSYVLGLDWKIPAAFEKVREDQKHIDSLRRAARDGDFGIDIGSAAELRTEVAVKRQHALSLRRQADSFTVIEEYERSEQEADELTRRLRDLRDSDSIDRDLLSDIEAAAASEAPPGAAELERLWEHANIVLPDHIRTTYDDVKVFHESVIRNRQLYLSREAELARERMTARVAERERVDRRRSELMQLLTSGGALQQFVALESEAARAAAEVRDLERRHELAEKFESNSAKTDGQRRELLLQLQGDHRDRADRLDRVIVLFEQYSRSLYEHRRGSLVVRETLNGPEFDVEIAGKGSVGIDSMQIFCFDLALATILRERGQGPGFLVHDSHIFDGVDERQTASALALAHDVARELGLQYVVTMNSDTSRQVSSSFDLAPFINPVRLTDAAEDGGLFGFRFD